MAAKIAALHDIDPMAAMKIWAKGMETQICRGYAAGTEVTVDKREDGLTCVRAPDDGQICFWVREAIGP